MKSEPTYDDRCGTYAGYKVHQKHNEIACTACKEAASAYTRARRRANPDLEHQYQKTARIRAQQKPEVVAAELERKREKTRLQEEKERQRTLAKEQALLLKQERIKINAFARKQRQYAKRKEQRAEKAVLRKAEKVRAQKAKEEALFWQRLQKEVDARDLRYTRKDLRNLEKAERQRLNAERRAQLAQQHGTTTGDYDRCRKLNGKACQPCRDVMAAYIRQYSKQNREKVTSWNRASDNRRRRNVEAAAYLLQDVFDRWGTDCHICNEPVDLTAPRQCGVPGWERGLHLDHVVPLSKGGPDTLDNVKPTHARCNLDKGDALI